MEETVEINQVSSLDQRVQNHIASFNEHLHRTDVCAHGDSNYSALKNLRAEMSDNKQDGVFEDYFEFARKYFEAVSSMKAVSVKRTTNTDGCQVLILDHACLREGTTDPVSLTSIAVVEINDKHHDPQTEELYSIRNRCDEERIIDFVATLDVNISKINDHFTGNHSSLMMSVFRDLVQSKLDSKSIISCSIVSHNQAEDNFRDFLHYNFVYGQYCTEQKRTVYCRFSLIMKLICFVPKPIVH